jgi:histidine phosphotransferase ChpT
MAEGGASAQVGLAQAVCTRLCHDLGGPTGALAGALELLEGTADEAAEVARDAVRIIDRRLRFWRAAVGGPSSDLDVPALAQLSEGLTLGRKAAVEFSGMAADAPIPPAMAQPLLMAMLVGVEAMPRGGTLHVSGHPAEGIGLSPEGPGAAWPPGLAALLAGEKPVLTPRGIALPLLAALAASGQVRLALAMGASGPGLLMLTPRG